MCFPSIHYHRILPGMISVKSCRKKIAIFEESVSIPMYYHGIILGNRYWKSPPQIYTILFSHLLPWDNTWEAISDILGKYMGKDNRDDMTPSQVLNFGLK